MQADNNPDLNAFLEKHPEIDYFEVLLPGISSGLRGKWVSREKIHKVFEGGLKLPITALAFDVWGRDHEELVFNSGDGDGVCRAAIHTLAPVPWLKRPAGQVLTSLDEVSGKSCACDARSILSRLVSRFEAIGLTPVVASEMEFYLLDADDESTGRPLSKNKQSYGSIFNAGQAYGIELMDEMAEVMHAIRDACKAQALPIDTLIKESAPSQYEINLHHVPNALLAADHALMLKRVIRGVAKQHGMRATFMAKPDGALAGNGMHIHCSLIDKNGKNAFNNGTNKGNDLLRFAVAGCLDTMAEVMLLLAPNLNSYRRFQRDNHVPLSETWGYENRTVSIRVPADTHESMRIEHRVAGADANCYLVITAVLAGMLYGLENKIQAPEPVDGNAYEQFPASLPKYWPDSLEKFTHSTFVKNYLGSEFQRVYSLIKQQEIDEFERVVTPLEYESYFSAL